MLRWDKRGHPPDHARTNGEPLEGFMNPLSYRYVTPEEILRIHDDIYLHGFPMRRSSSIPRVIHQFWEGSTGKPGTQIQKCKDTHHDWTHMMWGKASIKARFPSASNNAGPLVYDDVHGELVNQDFFDRAHEKNLLSDIMRYEGIMFYGGMYVDADTECFRPIDHLLREELGVGQGYGFLEKDENYIDGLVASGVIGTFAFSPLSIVLVEQLQHTDWTQSPWISAGPMHYTKTLKLFKAAVKDGIIPKYYDVHVLPSYHVYPYHHSDETPPHLRDSRVTKGAVMDQKWGTTKGNYITTVWQEHPPPTVQENVNDKWLFTLQDYARNVHHVGLSTLALHNPRWVVALFHPSDGITERIVNVLSSLAFALASGRTLLFDWDNHVSGPSASVDDLLARSPIHFSYQRALHRFGLEHNTLLSSSTEIQPDDVNFQQALRYSDIDSKYHAKVSMLTFGIETKVSYAVDAVSGDLHTPGELVGFSIIPQQAVYRLYLPGICAKRGLPRFF
jgi:hypothetical protein